MSDVLKTITVYSAGGAEVVGQLHASDNKWTIVGNDTWRGTLTELFGRADMVAWVSADECHYVITLSFATSKPLTPVETKLILKLVTDTNAPIAITAAEIHRSPS
jgi:hypothetical protein